MTCDQLDLALASDDPSQVAAARTHAETCGRCAEELRLWDDISAAARSLHREWESPFLWPRIRSRMLAEPATRRWLFPVWRPVLACALTLALLAPLGWYAWQRLTPGRTIGVPDRDATAARLLNEQALSDVERAEADYVRAIDALSARVTAQLAEPTSPLLMNLRERLIVIDAAIADCRAALERNRFNAHLRRELLSIYREKQRTLEQILESAKDVS